MRSTLVFAADFADMFEVRGTNARGARPRSCAPRCRRADMVLGYTGPRRPDARARRIALRARARRLERDRRCLRPRAAARRARLGPASIAIACGRSRTACTATRFRQPPSIAAALAHRAAPRARRAGDIEPDVQRDWSTARSPTSHMLITDDAARALSLCRHPLVQHAVRPRRHHHRARRCCGSTRHRPRRAAAPGRHPGDATTDPSADAEPGKILHEMRHGEMAALGEVPFGRYYGSVDATPLFVHARRRLLRAHRRPRDHRGVCGPTSWPRSTGSTATAIATATASSSIAAQRDKRPDQPGLEGLARLRSSTPTARSPKGRSRCARCRPTSTPPSGAIARVAAALGEHAACRKAAARGASSLRRAVRGRLLGRGARLPTRSRSTAHKQPLPVRSSNAGHALFTGIAAPTGRARTADRLLSSPTASPAGASARSRAARRATTRCPITTARSGRTTTR